MGCMTFLSSINCQFRLFGLSQDTDVLCDKAFSYVVSGKGAYGNLFSSISVNNAD